jgi:hypothetical protein
MNALSNARQMPLTGDSRTLDRLMIVWALFRLVLFVWTGFHFVTFPVHAQSRGITTGMGNSIVGRVVSSATGEGVPNMRIRIQGADLRATTDARGYYTVINILNGKYAVAVELPTSQEGLEILASRAIIIRGNDVNVPAIAVDEVNYAICGRVTFAHNRSEGVPNAQITLSGGKTVRTDAQGYYALDNLRSNAEYRVNASVQGHIVYGASRTVQTQQLLTRQNFIVESTSLAENGR